MNKIGILYLCEDKLNKQVFKAKEKFQSKSIKSKYLNHPAHLSIYVFEPLSNDYNYLKNDFKLLKNNLTAVKVEIKNWIIFENDILTGFNTLCLEINKTKELLKMQLDLVNFLKNYAKKKSNSKFSGEFLESNNKYGYPFVGTHWIPHISIGSMDISMRELNKFTKNQINHKNFVIDKIGLYEIIGDDHILIEKINLI